MPAFACSVDILEWRIPFVLAAVVGHVGDAGFPDDFIRGNWLVGRLDVAYDLLELLLWDLGELAKPVNLLPVESCLIMRQL